MNNFMTSSICFLDDLSTASRILQVTSVTYCLYKGWKNLIKSGSVTKTPCLTREIHIRDAKTTAYQCILKPDEVTPSRTVPDFIKKPPYILRGTVPPVGPDIEKKNEEQIQGVRKSCRLARKILDITASQLRVGMKTDDIDDIVHIECINNNSYPSPLMYKGFPKSVCTSVNNVACHGIPDLRPLHNGDIINIDITVYHDGYHGDVSETYVIGDVDVDGRRLVSVGKQCLDAGVAICKPGQRFCEIGKAISETAESGGFSVIPVFCGHGIGSYFHGPPDIIHIAYEDDQVMKEGMTFTIEPVITEGSPDIMILEDGWTAISIDNSRSAQFEHTVLVTSDGVDILTSKTL